MGPSKEYLFLEVAAMFFHQSESLIPQFLRSVDLHGAADSCHTLQHHCGGHKATNGDQEDMIEEKFQQRPQHAVSWAW